MYVKGNGNIILEEYGIEVFWSKLIEDYNCYL